MNKRLILIVLTLVIIGIIMWIFMESEQMKYTTYGLVMSTMVNKQETIIEVSIENTRNHESFRTGDKQIINMVLEEPADMMLKKQNKIPTVDYIITIHTNTNKNYFIMLGKNNLHIWGDDYDGDQYKIVGENKIYQLIETIEIKKF